MEPIEWAEWCIAEYMRQSKASRFPCQDHLMKRIIAEAVRLAVEEHKDQKP